MSMKKVSSINPTLLSGAMLALCASSLAAPPVEEELPGAKPPVMASPQARDTPAQHMTPATAAAMAAAMPPAEVMLEGEAIRAKASRGEVSVQDMSAHGDGWSGGKQRYWEAPGEGAMLTLAPDVPAGSYEVTLFLTQGPAYARIEAMGTKGVIPKSDVELYGPELAPPVEVSLGTLELGPELGFAIRIIGRDPRATGYSVGVDRISLVSVLQSNYGEAADSSSHGLNR
jgi:hypothetical protein